LAGGGLPVARFFLGCVVIAGLFGGVTVKRSILVIQALPAAVALAMVLL
jgi:putative membrane protein